MVCLDVGIQGRTHRTTLLLDNQALVDQQDEDGWSPLMFAVYSGDLKAFQHLIAHGASTHLKNFAGRTVFEIHPEKRKDLLMIIMQTLQTLPSTINEDLSELVNMSIGLVIIIVLSLQDLIRSIQGYYSTMCQ